MILVFALLNGGMAMINLAVAINSTNTFVGLFNWFVFGMCITTALAIVLAWVKDA